MRPQRFLFEELLVEILSWLPVKSLMKFRCVSKTWKSLISDSQFVKLHLQRSSSRNTGFSQAYLLKRGFAWHDEIYDQQYVVYPSISSLLERHSAMVAIRSCLHRYEFIGSCNGLISLKKDDYEYAMEKLIYHVCIWNPATRSKSQPSPPLYEDVYCDFGFGYDCSSDTYKVVAVMFFEMTRVNVYNMGDNCWRRIQVSPLPSLHLKGDAVYVSNTLNWLTTMRATGVQKKTMRATDNIDPYIIVSFDLGKEELTQFSLPPCPRRKDKFQDFEPILGVLRGFLSISQYDKKTHNFVVWQMKEFEVNKSWTQMLNIIGCNKIIKQPCSATCMFENGDVLLLAEYFSQAALYTKRENRLEGLRVSNNFFGCDVKSYIESLVSPY